jgi:hypothetical protein
VPGFYRVKAYRQTDTKPACTSVMKSRAFQLIELHAVTVKLGTVAG